MKDSDVKQGHFQLAEDLKKRPGHMTAEAKTLRIHRMCLETRTPKRMCPETCTPQIGEETHTEVSCQPMANKKFNEKIKNMFSC